MATVDPRDEPVAVVAAQRVVLELWTILVGFADAVTIVGGSAPPLLAGSPADDPYVGTLDVDLIVDPLSVPDEVYRTIAQLLRGRGYAQGDQPFRWSRTVTIDEREITVEVDLLAPVTPRTPRSHRHERVGGEPLARRTEGAELVRDSAVERDLVGLLPDGRHHQARVRVAAPAAFIVLKALAMGSRDKPKDAYDIDYVLRHLDVDEVAADIAAFGDVTSVRTARAILADRFASVDSLGSQSVALYRRLPLGSGEADQAQAQAFARVRRLLARAAPDRRQSAD